MGIFTRQFDYIYLMWRRYRIVEISESLSPEKTIRSNNNARAIKIGLKLEKKTSVMCAGRFFSNFMTS